MQNFEQLSFVWRAYELPIFSAWKSVGVSCPVSPLPLRCTPYDFPTPKYFLVFPAEPLIIMCGNYEAMIVARERLGICAYNNCAPTIAVRLQ